MKPFDPYDTKDLGITELTPQKLAETIQRNPCYPLAWLSGFKPPEQVAVHEGIADLGDTQLWYWDTGGEGETIILLHAATQSHESWIFQQPIFTKAGYRVIAYSRRGYRKSDLGDKANPGCGSEDLKKLMSHLGVERAHLVGVAHGSYFALDFAISFPRQVISLCLSSSMLGITDSEYRELYGLFLPKYFAQLPHDFQELGPSYRAGCPEGVAAWNEITERARPGGRVMPTFLSKMSWAEASSLPMPVLLMTGDADLYTPPAVWRVQTSKIPQAECKLIAESGHSPNWEQPEVFNAHVLEFVGRHGGSAQADH